MSDVSKPTRKISREGIILIKSFEGFRPRAIQRAEGGWIIGYGHTLSAREGATVSEGDAELLLRYDLLPIEKSVNDAAPTALNQHQFDALVSFGFSVGRERFETSDVLARLTGGATGEAAEAMMAWPAAEVPSAGLRRRAAERALFQADPSRPISLAELLTVPLPEASIQTVTDAEPEPSDDPVEPIDSRGAAVAALLGEAEREPVETAPIVPTFAPIAAKDEPQSLVVDPPEPAVPPHEPVENPATETPPEPVVVAANDADADGEGPGPDPASDVVSEPVPDAPELEAHAPVAPETPETPIRVDEAPIPARSPAEGAAFGIQRYAPYGTPIVGPLPFLQPAAPPADNSASPAPVAFEANSSTETLVLTSPDEAPPAVLARPAWTADERDEAQTIAQPETGLFGDDLALTQGGQPLGRPDLEADPPQTFDWSETGAFIIMGAVGLTAFGASMAAFRLASEQGYGDETSIIGWVLAVIGVACVGVSSLNLYRRFGLPGGDR